MKQLPLVVPCGGDERAAAVAAELAERGVARTGDTATPRVRRVVALEGCASHCATLRLSARGVRPAAVVDVGAGDVAELAAEVERRLRDGDARPARHRRAPRRQLAPDGRGRHGPDDYLLALDVLASSRVECGALLDDVPVPAAHVAQALGVSRPSAGEMLTRLETDGLVGRTDHREVFLTPAGRTAADAAVRRQRLLERFAVDVLGYGAEECSAQARTLAPGFRGELVDRLDAALGFPSLCPHGRPVDAAAARRDENAPVRRDPDRP